MYFVFLWWLLCLISATWFALLAHQLLRDIYCIAGAGMLTWLACLVIYVKWRKENKRLIQIRQKPAAGTYLFNTLAMGHSMLSNVLSMLHLASIMTVHHGYMPEYAVIYGMHVEDLFALFIILLFLLCLLGIALSLNSLREQSTPLHVDNSSVNPPQTNKTNPYAPPADLE